MPYNFIRSKKATGIDVEIATAILKNLEHTAKFIPLPHSRESIMASKGEIDLILSMYCNYPQPSSILATTQSLYSIDIALFEPINRTPSIFSLANLKLKSVGAVRGDAVVADLQKWVKSDILLTKSTEYLVSQLVLNRFDAAVGEDIAFRYFAKIKNQKIRHAFVYRQLDVCMGISQTALQERALPLRNAIDEQLLEFKATGSIQAIIDRYIQDL